MNLLFDSYIPDASFGDHDILLSSTLEENKENIEGLKNYPIHFFERRILKELP